MERCRYPCCSVDSVGRNGTTWKSCSTDSDAAATARRAGRSRWWRAYREAVDCHEEKHLPWIGVALLFVVAVVAFAKRSHKELHDFEVYRVAGARAAAGESLYRESDGHWQFKYLPAFAVAIAPLAQLPPVAARGVWFFLSVALLVVLVNRSYAMLPDRRRRAAFLVWLTILAMGKFYVREVGLGQSNVLLAVLVLAAVACWIRGRDIAAGALLAAAAVVKPYAILFLPYLVARRKWSGGRELRRRPARRAGVAGPDLRLVRQRRGTSRVVDRGDHVDRAESGRTRTTFRLPACTPRGWASGRRRPG